VCLLRSTDWVYKYYVHLSLQLVVKICFYNNADHYVTCFKLRREQHASSCVPVSTQEYNESVPVSSCSRVTVTGHTRATAEINRGNAETLGWMKASYVNNCCMQCHFTGVSRDVIPVGCFTVEEYFVFSAEQKDMKYTTYRVPIYTVATDVKTMCQYCCTVTVCHSNPHCLYISAHCYQYVR